MTAMHARPELPDMPSMDCPDCDGTLILRHKPAHWRGGSIFAYLCTTSGCRGLCSAHPDGTPSATPVNAETRRARNLTHQAFDPLWLEAINLPCYLTAGMRHRAVKEAHRAISRRARCRAYAWLAEQMNMLIDECHIGLFDIETCRIVWKLCQGMDAAQIRAWGKAREQ